MGFVQEVGAGIAIGEAISSGIVKYSKSEYLSYIHTLSGLFSELGNHLNNMEGLEVRFSQIYTDGNAAELRARLKTQIQSVKNAQLEVTEQMKLFEDTIKEMEDTVGKQQDKIDDIKRITDALNILD